MNPGSLDWVVADREILLTLFQSHGEVDVYFFYEQFNLRPAEILTSIRKLHEIGVIAFNPETMFTSLTATGRFFVVENRREIFMRKVALTWKAPPSSYVRPQVDILEPYVPKRRYISKDFFDALAPKS
jgi:hypothetical protein